MKVVWPPAGTLVSIPVVFTAKSPLFPPVVLTPVRLSGASPVFRIVKVFAALVVPSAAVQTGQQGPYVFVVKADATVETRRVTVARTQGSDTIVATGLQAGERVVTDGQPRLVNGAKVEVRTNKEVAPRS